MTAVRDNTNAQRIIAGIAVRTTTGLMQIAGAYVRDAANASRSVLATLKPSASPDAVYGYAYSASPTTITTQSTTASAGGAASPTFQWSGGGTGWSITNPTGATTAFRRTGVGRGASYQAVFTCTITSGTQSATTTVTAEVDNNYGE